MQEIWLNVEFRSTTVLFKHIRRYNFWSDYRMEFFFTVLNIYITYASNVPKCKQQVISFWSQALCEKKLYLKMLNSNEISLKNTNNISMMDFLLIQTDLFIWKESSYGFYKAINLAKLKWRYLQPNRWSSYSSNQKGKEICETNERLLRTCIVFF